MYGHYDVQPAEPLDLWTSPAFEPTERDGKLFARGATDDKGQMLTHVLAALAWHEAAGGPPIDLVYVIEGEEEVGSNNLDAFLAERAGELKADIAVISDTAQYGPGRPAITHGLRGIFAAEVTVAGPDRDLHSGVFGGAIANPANELCRLVGMLHDAEGRVAIPGYYDSVRDLSDEERRRLAELPFDEAAFLGAIGVPAPAGEEGFTTLERRWCRPTLDVNGLTAGYQGEGPKTIVPAKASAKITGRLVPDQDPRAVAESLEAFLKGHARPGVAVSVQHDHGAPAVAFDPSGPAFEAASRAIEAAFGTAPVFIREGGSIPVVGSLKTILGIDTLLLGWGLNSDNLHSPDEHFTIADFHRGTQASARLFAELANS